MMTFNPTWPQVVILSLFANDLLLTIFLHGKERAGKYNAWVSVLECLIVASLLHWAGFWSTP